MSSPVKMPTPTPGKHPQVVATPPVSTPYSHLTSASANAGFSPRGPRSIVPSPQQFKKSPANSQTVYGHPTGNSFGGMNFDSPNTQAALASLPNIGMDGIGALSGGLGLNGMDGGMGLTGLGMGVGVNVGRDSDDEKRRKLQQVIDILKNNKGRVSEEGVERLARGTGLECLWEDQMGGAGTVRTLIIAGTGLSIDIDFTNNVVGKVALSFPESPEMVTIHAEEAGKILLRDLQLKDGESPLTKMLDKFSANLERLATLDKLSVMPTLNCYEAIAGIHESLKRLHQWELARLKEQTKIGNSSKEHLTQTVLRTKSGRPTMNAREHVGLSLDYWQEKGSTASTERGEMSHPPKTWSLIIECAASSALAFPSIRVTDNWLSKDVEKANPTADDLLGSSTGSCLDWLNPENLVLPNPDTSKNDVQMDDMADLNTKLPDVMFVAKFHPPLAVSYAAAMSVHMACGANMDGQMSLLDTLLLPPEMDVKAEPDGAYRRVRTHRLLQSFSKAGERSQKKHCNTLTIHKADYGYSISALPFSHPRQLIEIMPTLRQYACISSLLDHSFSGSSDSLPDTRLTTSSNTKDDFLAFMTTATMRTGGDVPQNFPVDVSLYTSPNSQMRVTFPLKEHPADIWFEIGDNGTIAVLSQNILAHPDESKSRKDLAKILERTENFGIFAEYVRERLR